MLFRRSLGLVVLLAISFTTGCSMTNPTVRSQNPDCPPGAGPMGAGPVGTGAMMGPGTGPIVGTAPGYGQFKRAPYMGNHGHHDFKPYSKFQDNNLGFEGGFYAGPDRYVSDANLPYTYDNGNGCPECNFGQNCPDGGCRHCGRGCGYRHGMPQHYQTYQYNWPSNMVYPTQGVPSGLVQYPYYTLRGPTDFFMK